MQTETKSGQTAQPGCAVSSKLNYGAGAVAVAAGLGIAWFAWRYFAG